MDSYLLLVFLHVVGAIGIFVGLGVEAVAVRGLARAGTVELERIWVALLRRSFIGPVGMVVNLITGIWMMVVRWGPGAWMFVALGGVVAMIAIGVTMTMRPVARLNRSRSEDAVSGSPVAAARRPLVLSLWLRVFIALGIVGLMTIKPALTGSLAIMAIALLMGVGIAARREQRPVPATT